MAARSRRLRLLQQRLGGIRGRATALRCARCWASRLGRPMSALHPRPASAPATTPTRPVDRLHGRARSRRLGARRARCAAAGRARARATSSRRRRDRRGAGAAVHRRQRVRAARRRRRGRAGWPSAVGPRHRSATCRWCPPRSCSTCRSATRAPGPDAARARRVRRRPTSSAAPSAWAPAARWASCSAATLDEGRRRRGLVRSRRGGGVRVAAVNAVGDVVGGGRRRARRRLARRRLRAHHRGSCEGERPPYPVAARRRRSCASSPTRA